MLTSTELNYPLLHDNLTVIRMLDQSSRRTSYLVKSKSEELLLKVFTPDQKEAFETMLKINSLNNSPDDT